MGKSFGDAKLPSLKDKIRDQEIQRERELKELEKEVEETDGDEESKAKVKKSVKK